MEIIKKKDLKKVKNIPYEKLEMQKYLGNDNIFTNRKKLIFKIRTNMINVGWNFGRHVQCPLCLKENDDQGHLIKCSAIINSQPSLKLSDINLEDLLRNNSDKANEIAISMEKILNRREVILESKRTNS